MVQFTELTTLTQSLKFLSALAAGSCLAFGLYRYLKKNNTPSNKTDETDATNTKPPTEGVGGLPTEGVGGLPTEGVSMTTIILDDEDSPSSDNEDQMGGEDQ
jgi:hypothetical protein